jgi:hypothetical protein
MISSKRPTLRLKTGSQISIKIPTKRIEYRVLKHESETEWTILRNGVSIGKPRRKKQSAIDMAIKDAQAERETSKAAITVTLFEAGKVTTEWIGR